MCDDNPADMFTKPISAVKFFKFRDMIMNVPKGGKLSANAAVFYPSSAQSIADCTACGDIGYVKGEPCWFCNNAPPSYRPGDLPHSLTVPSRPNLSLAVLSGPAMPTRPDTPKAQSKSMTLFDTLLKFGVRVRDALPWGAAGFILTFACAYFAGRPYLLFLMGLPGTGA